MLGHFSGSAENPSFLDAAPNITRTRRKDFSTVSLIYTMPFSSLLPLLSTSLNSVSVCWGQWLKKFHWNESKGLWDGEKLKQTGDTADSINLDSSSIFAVFYLDLNEALFFFKYFLLYPWASQVALVVKKPACQCWRHKRCGFDPWVGEIPWRRAWQPTPVFLPGEAHGQRSLGATVHGVTKSRRRVMWPSMHAHGESPFLDWLKR